MLDRTLRQKFLESLVSLPSAVSYDGRMALLSGLPPNIRLSLTGSNTPQVHFINMLEGLEPLGRLTETGERPLIIIAQNALMQVAGAKLGEAFKEIIAALERHYGDDQPSELVPAIPEIMIFEGRDERLPPTFFEQALEAGKAVARLMIPQIFRGNIRTEACFGTGWLVSPRLLLTNYHVMAARDPFYPPLTASDLTAQAEQTHAWFDYHQEGGSRCQVRCAAIAASLPELDYALLRLEDAPGLAGRTPLRLRHPQPELTQGVRLNIIQHPRGGPLRFAVRNNFYVGPGDKPFQLRYLTDTEPGASGSPVLDDAWRVAALHHAHQPIPHTEYKGEIIRYHNQGIAIHDIVASLPEALREEIENKL